MDKAHSAVGLDQSVGKLLFGLKLDSRYAGERSPESQEAQFSFLDPLGSNGSARNLIDQLQMVSSLRMEEVRTPHAVLYALNETA